MKSIFPESTPPPLGKKDWQIHAWGVVTLVIAGIPALLIARTHFDFNNSSNWLKAAFAVVPVITSMLWTRSVVRWIRGLDELQRRIQGEAWVFTVIGVLLITTTVNALQQRGVLKMVLQRSRYPVANDEFFQVLGGVHGLGWIMTIMLITPLWIIGLVIANRRYK